MLKVESKQDELPCGCENYEWLSNPNRKTTYATPSNEYKCDKSGYSDSSRISPDWQGVNWYRIDPRIGTKIPTSSTKEKYCGTWAAGWIQGPSTPRLGQTIESNVCFVGSSDDCAVKTNIKIRNCGQYNLYYLPDTPGCWYGYCVE